MDADAQSQLVGFALLVTGVVGEWLRRRRRARRETAAARRAAPRNLARTRLIRHRLGELGGELGGQRAICIKVSNGGTVPRPGCAMFITITNEWKAPSVPTVLGLYEGRPLRDPDYEALVLHVDREKLVLVHTEEMPEGSLLRDAYEAVGLVSSWVFVVRYEPGAMHYASVSSRLRLEDTPASRDSIRAYASVLNHLLSKELGATDDELDIDP